MTDDAILPPPANARRTRFRRTVVRGLALALPPVLTIVILLWIWGTVEVYLLKPVEDAAVETLVWSLREVRDPPPGTAAGENVLVFDSQPFVRLANGQYVPEEVVTWLRNNVPYEPIPTRPNAVYRRYVRERYLQRSTVLPVFLCAFVLVLYLLGKLLAVGFGDFLDRGIHHLPLVRSVYGSVKKVTNFVFINHQVHYKRVVAVEYPRKGIWSIGLVTSDGVHEVNGAAREPCVTVVLPGSPTPITGYCVMVPLRETFDLHMTIDQALQFYVSCGVAVPGPRPKGAASGALDAGAPGNGLDAARSPPLAEGAAPDPAGS